MSSSINDSGHGGGAQPRTEHRDPMNEEPRPADGTLPSAVNSTVTPDVNYAANPDVHFGASDPTAATGSPQGWNANASVTFPTAAARVPVATAPSALTLQGVLLEQPYPDRVRVRYPVLGAFLNSHGALQGGFLVAMIDNAIELCLQNMNPARQAATLEFSVRYFRAIRSGHVIVDSAVLRSGRTTTTIECVAWDDASELCAKATATTLFVG